MSPVTNMGPTCSEDGCARPIWKSGLCSPCYRLKARFGHLNEETVDEPAHGRPTRFDVLADAGVAHRADTPEFENELRDWLEVA